jgi:hypothetical protein
MVCISRSVAVEVLTKETQVVDSGETGETEETEETEEMGETGETEETEGRAAAAPQFTHRVVARQGLNLRSGPGTEFAVIRVLPLGTSLNVIKPYHSPWAPVDLLGDGINDGHVHLSFVEMNQGA